MLPPYTRKLNELSNNMEKIMMHGLKEKLNVNFCTLFIAYKAEFPTEHHIEIKKKQIMKSNNENSMEKVQLMKAKL